MYKSEAGGGGKIMDRLRRETKEFIGFAVEIEGAEGGD